MKNRTFYYWEGYLGTYLYGKKKNLTYNLGVNPEQIKTLRAPNIKLARIELRKLRSLLHATTLACPI